MSPVFHSLLKCGLGTGQYAVSVLLVSVEKSLLLDSVSSFTLSYTGHFAYAFYVEAQL